MYKHQVTIRAPPKSVFQILWDPSHLEELGGWKVTLLGDEFGPGFQWREKRLVRSRTWTVTAFDRKGLTFTATWKGVELTMACKKGGPGSCNVQMKIEGDPRAAAAFERTDGGRLDAFKAWLD